MNEGKELKDALKGLRQKKWYLAPKFLISESIIVFRNLEDKIPTTNFIPIGRLLVLSANLNGFSMNVLKDAGCSTSVISR